MVAKKWSLVTMGIQGDRSVAEELFSAPAAACRCERDGAGEVCTAEETHGEHPGAAGGHQPPAGEDGGRV